MSTPRITRFDTMVEAQLRASGNSGTLRQALEMGIDSKLDWLIDIIKELIDDVLIYTKRKVCLVTMVVILLA